MRKGKIVSFIILSLSITIMVNLTSCGNTKGKESGMDSTSNVDAIKMTSFEFLQKSSDNFFFKDNVGKTFTVSNCLVTNYTLSGTNNTNEIMLIGYDIAQNEISELLEDRDESFGGALVGETNIKRRAPNNFYTHFFATLSNSRDIQNLSFYDSNSDHGNNRKLNNQDQGHLLLIHFNDLVTITGTLVQKNSTNGVGESIIVPGLENCQIIKQPLSNKKTQNDVTAEGIRSCLAGSWKIDYSNKDSSVSRPLKTFNFFNKNEFNLKDEKELNTIENDGKDTGYESEHNFAGRWELVTPGKVVLYFPNFFNDTLLIKDCSRFVIDGYTYIKQP